MRTIHAGVAVAAAIALTACGEPSQDMAAGAKTGTPSWQGTDNGFLAEGWKAGDQSSWQEQMRRRAQYQNEYVRSASRAG